MIAKIAVSAANYAIDKPYSYFFPDELPVVPGMRVQIPFGRSNRRVEGIVLSIHEGFQNNLKTVELCLDSAPLLSESMLRLAAFMRERYFCTIYEAVRTMLPAGLWFQEKGSFQLTQDRSWTEKLPKKEGAAALLQALEDLGGHATGKQLQQFLANEQVFEEAIAYLLRKKWIAAQTAFVRRTSDKTEKIATLAVSAEEAMNFALSLPRASAMQRGVIQLMCSVGTASVKEVCYFTGAKPATVKRLAELGYLELSEKELLRCRQIIPAKLDGPLVLNDAQRKVYEGLQQQMHSATPGSALLYGVTGSGKTSVYISLINDCIRQGKQAILLVPEIALTPQLLGLMAAHFGDAVAVLHSSLPATERYDQWKRIASMDAKVVVGTRSAVFAPCENLGVIILDEEQEHSYKSENSPRYSAKEVALWRGLKNNCLVLLGSATPSVETMYHAKNGDHRLYTLPQRYNGKPLPKVQIVDMKEQLKLGNDLSLSYPLQDAIRQTADKGKQTILFLNRRGNSRALVCVHCGETPECPHCSNRLTYHSANERMMCHYCGYSEPVPKTCPACGGVMKPVGSGTQKIQQEILGIYPDISVERMDADTVTAVNTHEKIFERFQKDNVSVLVGTQMVAKGLNLPNVTLVGVLDADLSLYAENYRSAETTFSMLTQVVGRAGRGEDPGQAIIQTVVPEHQVILLASRQDYDGFYDMEIGLRRMQNYPPFADVAVVTFIGQDQTKVIRGAQKFRDSLLNCLTLPEYRENKCTVLGPAPCVVPKINNHYRFRLTLRCNMDRTLRLLLGHLLRQFSLDKETRGVSGFIDVNGFE